MRLTAGWISRAIPGRPEEKVDGRADGRSSSTPSQGVGRPLSPSDPLGCTTGGRQDCRAVRGARPNPGAPGECQPRALAPVAGAYGASADAAGTPDPR